MVVAHFQQNQLVHTQSATIDNDTTEMSPHFPNLLDFLLVLEDALLPQ